MDDVYYIKTMSEYVIPSHVYQVEIANAGAFLMPFFLESMSSGYDVATTRSYPPNWNTEERLEQICRYDRAACIRAYYSMSGTAKSFECHET